MSKLPPNMPDTVLRESAKQAVRRLTAELEVGADELCYADPVPLLSAPTARLARAVLLAANVLLVAVLYCFPPPQYAAGALAVLLVLPLLILDALLLSGMEGAWRFTPQNFVRLDRTAKP